MKNNPRKRDDISKFLVHLTKDNKKDKINAIDNLINILDEKKIKAKNPHCLFNPIFDNLGFSKELKKQFNTVCFTEAPLDQIHKLTRNILKRQVNLQPYGLVFWKNKLLELGANPAIYINAKGTDMNNFLLNSFRKQFKNITCL